MYGPGVQQALPEHTLSLSEYCTEIFICEIISQLVYIAVLFMFEYIFDRIENAFARIEVLYSHT